VNREQFQKEVAALLNQEESFSLGQEEEHSLYSSAFTLYANQAYRKASSVFTRLVLINPFSAPYWKGLAASKQMAREYEQALRAWALATLLDTNDPTIHLHAAECLYKVDDKEEAKKALNCAASLLPSLCSDERFEELQRRLDVAS